MRNRNSIGRTIVAVLGLVAVAPALAGCEGADASIPPTRHLAQSSIAFAPSHIAFAGLTQPATDTEGPSTAVDLATILTGARVITRSAERTAAELPALRRAITLSALALLGIGLLNAALLGAILHALRGLMRATTMLGAARLTPPAPAVTTPVAMTVREDTAAACECGKPISPRSSSGRCRNCANRSRSNRVVA